MEELTYKGKIAIIKILSEILHADNIVHDSEVAYMNNVISSFNLTSSFQIEVDNLKTLQALSTIREFTIARKREVAKMMGKMIVIDNNINYNEVKLYNTFCELCNMEKNFSIEDYPEYSLSDPFVNPEELLNI